MAAPLVDTHTHLDSKEFDADREEVIQRARDAFVTRIITVGASDGVASAHRAIALAEKYDFIWATAGVHPHDAGKGCNLEELRTLAQHPRVVAVGETGLDFYRDWSPKPDQYRYFEAQVSLALEIKKPLVIHSREAGNECLRILHEMGAAAVGGVFHCYAEDAGFASKLRDINFLVSFPGVLTFKKALVAKQAAKEIPIDQILVETDAPYMAPEPFRGKRCETSHVVQTARVLAEIKGLSLDEVAEATTRNALRLFRAMN